MARGDQLARQWKIVQTLIASRMGKSAADIARDLDCHPRTIYRDLDALQSAGFPVYTERIDGKSLWSLLDTVKHHFPIPFSLTELMALYFSRDVLRTMKGTVFYDALESLFQKIREQKDGSVIFEAEVSGTDEVKFWVMSWGSMALVLEPASLREEIRSECALTVDQYDRNTGVGRDRMLS
jgi:predicted DNA-binding transcriptional regulator YafY